MDGVEKQMKTGWGAEDKREKEKDWERERQGRVNDRNKKAKGYLRIRTEQNSEDRKF